MSDQRNLAPQTDRGGFCLPILGVLALLLVIGRCTGGDSVSQGSNSPPTEASTRERSMENLKAESPRIPADGIRLPSEQDLRKPDFDVGGHCLAEERAGRGSFEACLEVVGRELIAIGATDRQ